MARNVGIDIFVISSSFKMVQNTSSVCGIGGVDVVPSVASGSISSCGNPANGVLVDEEILREKVF
jgi:hypothetical protein